MRSKRLKKLESRTRCAFCGITEAEAGAPHELDHFVPRSRGGTNHPSNLNYACGICNKLKSGIGFASMLACQIYLVHKYYESKNPGVIARRRLAFNGLPPHAFVAKADPRPEGMSKGAWLRRRKRRKRKIQNSTSNAILITRALAAATKWQNWLARKNEGNAR